MTSPTSQSISWTKKGGCQQKVGQMDLSEVCTSLSVSHYQILILMKTCMYKSGNIYHIYKQDDHTMDMFTHLQLWLDYLEHAIGGKLQPDNYIFLFIATNGQVHVNWPMSHDYIQSLITCFTAKVGLEKHYTTHCVQCGGAQYWFMLAPTKEQWSLNAIHWWGGWASGKHVCVAW